MSDQTPNAVPFHYIKSNFFHVSHTDGAIGNITPAGLIFVSFYSERAAIPQTMVHEITETGQVGSERLEERVSKKGIVRELEIGTIMSPETAQFLVTWLQEQISLIKQMRDTEKLESSRHGNA